MHAAAGGARAGCGILFDLVQMTAFLHSDSCHLSKAMFGSLQLVSGQAVGTLFDLEESNGHTTHACPRAQSLLFIVVVVQLLYCLSEAVIVCLQLQAVGTLSDPQ